MISTLLKMQMGLLHEVCFFSLENSLTEQILIMLLLLNWKMEAEFAESFEDWVPFWSSIKETPVIFGILFFLTDDWAPPQIFESVSWGRL